MRLLRAAVLALVPTLCMGCSSGEGSYGSTADIGRLLTNFESSVADLITAWNDIPPLYRGGGCLAAGILLVLRATSRGAQQDRSFFVVGMLAIALIAYGGMVLIPKSR